MGLPRVTVHRPVFTLMILGALILLGLIALFRLQVELYQGGNRGIISVMVRVRGGMAPREIEKLATKQMEEGLATVSHVKNLYSHSREGEARVTMEFEPGTDMRFAALEVREKFAKVIKKLPDEIEKPVIANYSEQDNAIIVFSVTSEEKTPEEIREIVDTELSPLLLRVSGVASVDVYGGRERKILIELDKDRMVAYNIAIERVMDIIGAGNLNLLGGTVDKDIREISVRTIGGFTSIEDIGDMGIASTPQGTIISLKEIATVKDAYLEPEDFARLNLTENISVQVKKTANENTIKVARDIRDAVLYYQETSKLGMQFTTVSDHSVSIQKAIKDVLIAMGVGVILTTLVLYAFLRAIKLAFLIFIAIPISILITFIFMAAQGISINIMTLTGIAMAIGMLVDNSIVTCENIFKKREQGLSEREAIIQGSEEMWLVLLASTVTTIAVFLPILFIDKSIQLLYQGLAFTVTVSLVASLFSALGFLPMLADRTKVFADIKKTDAYTGDREIHHRKSQKFYRKVLVASFRNRYPLLIIVGLLFLLSIKGLADMDIDLPSTLEENEFGVIVFPIAGADLAANNRVAGKLEEMLDEFPEVESFSSVVRKDDLRIMVKLIPRKKRVNSKDYLMEYMREKGKETIKEVHEDYSMIVDEGISSDEARKIIVNIFGNDNDELEKLAHEVAKKMGAISGITNIVMTDLRKRPEYDLVVDRGRARFFGISVKDIADSMHAQIRGMRPTKYHEAEGGKEIEAIIRLQAIYRQKLEDLQKIYIFSPSKKKPILLEQMASFYPSFGPNTIDRKDKYRYVFVKADTSMALESAAELVREQLSDIEFPQDYFYRFGGSYPDLVKSRSQLSFAVLITIVLIYMILACLFQSYAQPLLILVAVPLATIGIYAGLKMTGKSLSEHVFIGMIILAGTVVNNSTVLVDHYNHLKDITHDRFELLIRTGEDRLRPILMTTVSSVLGFMPMAFGIGQSSSLWSPLAVTVIGGLVSSSILTLFIIPAIILVTEDACLWIQKSLSKVQQFIAKRLLLLER